MLELDGTDNKAKLGANAILAVSLAAAKVRWPLCLYYDGPYTMMAPSAPTRGAESGRCHVLTALRVC